MDNGPTVGTITQMPKSGRLTWFPFEVVIAVLMMVSGTAQLSTPEELSPGFPLWASYVVGVLYLMGGATLILGLWKLRAKIEYIGLVCLMIGISFSSFATLIAGGPFVRTLLTFGVVAWGCFIRATTLAKNKSTIQVEEVR